MRLTLLAALFCAATALFAQDDAYQARVDVPDQAAATRDPALRDALGQVIARVSGEGSLAQAQAIVARAAQLVQRYGYERDPATRQLQLVAAFDPKAVDAALKAQGLPVWGLVAGPVEDVAVEVAGVQGAADYGTVLGSLRGLAGVRAVQVLGARADHLSLQLRIEGGAARVAGAASIGALVRDDSVASGVPGFRLNH